EVGLGGFLHLGENHRRDFRRRGLLALDLDPGIAIVALDDLERDEALVLLHQRVVVAPSDQALDREHRAFGIGDRLPLGRLADQPLAVLRERHHGRSGARALGILDDLRSGHVHYGDAAIGGAEVDTDYFSHYTLPLSWRTRVEPHRSGSSVARCRAGSLVGMRVSERPFG